MTFVNKTILNIRVYLYDIRLVFFHFIKIKIIVYNYIYLESNIDFRVFVWAISLNKSIQFLARIHGYYFLSTMS